MKGPCPLEGRPLGHVQGSWKEGFHAMKVGGMFNKKHSLQQGQINKVLLIQRKIKYKTRSNKVGPSEPIKSGN